MNYFELLQIEQRYDLDLKEIEKNYFASLSKFHPDRAKTEQEKTNFLSLSTAINNAYQIFIDDLKRAKYMLLLQNIDIDDEKIKDKFPAHNLEKIWLDFEFIDDNDDVQILERFKNQKILEKQSIIVKITEAFASFDQSMALEQTLLLKYLTNILDNLNLKIKNVTN